MAPIWTWIEYGYYNEEIDIQFKFPKLFANIPVHFVCEPSLVIHALIFSVSILQRYIFSFCSIRTT